MIIKEIPKAYCGYNQKERAFVSYTGNLTIKKEEKIREFLAWNLFKPGWKTSNVRIYEAVNGLNRYHEDGASGATIVKIFDYESI